MPQDKRDKIPPAPRRRTRAEATTAFQAITPLSRSSASKSPPSHPPPSKSRGPGRPSSAAAPEDQRARILDAAAAHFAQNGFAGASLRLIAKSAGLSHAMIRHLFGDKDALWEAAADHLFSPMRAAMATAMAGVAANDPVLHMEAQVRACVRVAAQAPSFAGFVMQAGLAGGPRYEALVEKRLRPLYALALEPYRRFSVSGAETSAPAHFVFLIATNAAINPFAQAANSQALAGLDLSDPSIADAYADTLVAVLKHGVLGRSP